MVSFLTQKGSTSCGCAQHNWINTFQQANAFLRTRIRQADDPRGTFVHSLCWQVRRQHVQCATSGSQCSCQLHALCASKILEKVSTGVISHLFLMPLETERNEWTRKKTLHKHAQTALNRRKHQEHLPGKVKLNHVTTRKSAEYLKALTPWTHCRSMLNLISFKIWKNSSIHFFKWSANLFIWLSKAFAARR